MVKRATGWSASDSLAPMLSICGTGAVVVDIVLKEPLADGTFYLHSRWGDQHDRFSANLRSKD